MPNLWALLGEQTARYTMGDSTSVSMERAQELMASLWYTLKKALGDGQMSGQMLLTGELYTLVQRGQAVILAEKEAARQLWKRACLTAPRFENDFYRDTLIGIGQFFKEYDCYYFAHQIPCSIDYPLLSAVSESLEGVDYVTEYLKRLLMENNLLRRFDQSGVSAVLESISGDYRSNYLNLCEQPLVNAIGRALNKKPVGTLGISAQDREEILAALSGAEKEHIRKAAAAALQTVGAELGCPVQVIEYLSDVAAQLTPRLDVAITHRDLSNIFVSYSEVIMD
ncbi:MAG: DUF6179 domain-containing protein [Oscillospiraceae bacterium]|nr:DUF6179 domain-containing protein [Oscillospiraceae bacterium]